MSVSPASSSPGELAGVVFNDLNADHVRQAGEPGLAGVRVYLDTNRNGRDDGERSTLTNSAGSYQFTGVAPGGYVVGQEVPAGFRQLVPTAGYGQHASVYAAKSTTVAPFVDHRNVGALSGFVYIDLNRSGQRSPGEPGLAGAQVTAVGTYLSPYYSTTLTDASGHYAFTGLAPGTYVMNVQPPPGARVIGPIYRSITRTIRDFEITGNNFGIELRAPGAVDPSFGDGEVANQAPLTFGGNPIAVEPDGAVIAGSFDTSPDGNYSSSLSRITPAGKLDGSFGNQGNVATVRPAALLTQKDGRILAVSGSDSYPSPFAVARFLPNGAPDLSFGSMGIAQSAIGFYSGYATAAALQPDGKIVVAGASLNAPGQYQFTLVRYRSDGTPDPSFGVGGVVVTPLFLYDDEARAVTIQPDGKIVVAGGVQGPADTFPRWFALARYTADGRLDPTFGTGGIVMADTGWSAQAVALDSAGRILVAGGQTLARYDSAGRPDPSFGVGGGKSLDFQAQTMALQANGKIVLGGLTFISGSKGDDQVAAVECFTMAGVIDPSFAFSPFDALKLSTIPSAVTTLAVAPDGGILILANQSLLKLIGDPLPTV
jgi:uncharacterized delta-60 repeat protein